MKMFLMTREQNASVFLEALDLSPPAFGLLHISPDLQRKAELWFLLKVRFAMSTGQDPTHEIAHFPGNKPGEEQSDVFGS